MADHRRIKDFRNRKIAGRMISGIAVVALMLSVSGCQGGAGSIAQPQSAPGSLSASPSPGSSQAFINAGMDDPVSGVVSDTIINTPGTAPSGPGNPGTASGERQVIRNQVPEVGKTVKFGAFEQDGDFGNGPEPIEWIILKQFEDNGAYLLMSVYCLDNVDYDTREKVRITDSMIQSYLLDEFYNEAFNEEEKSVMNKYQTTYNGNTVTDFRVSLITPALIRSYLKDNKARQAKATPFAESVGVDVQDGYCWYWLMPNDEKGVLQDGYAAGINYDGTVMEKISIDQSKGGGVRPLIVVRLDELMSN